MTISLPSFTSTINSISFDGSTTIFINDVEGRNKIDITLRNYTMLWENDYIDNDKIRVNILFHYEKNVNYYFLGTPHVNEIDYISSEINELNGSILSTSDFLPLLTAQIPYEKIFLLAEQEFVTGIFLDRRISICLDESVPIIKNPIEWAQIENYFGFDINGSNIKIAILDTGIDKNHPDLNDLDDNPETNDPKVVAEKCFTDEGHAWDGYGHGTHCASIAAGTGEASNYVYVGVAPQALLLNGKVLSDGGYGYDSWIISGIEWAVINSANIISMSLGADVNGDGTDPLSLALDWAIEQGVTCVVAAGNAGSGGMFTVGRPGVSIKAITVGATTKTGEIAAFSSQGPSSDYRIKPDVCAPGVDIVAARAGGTSMGVAINDYYTRASGTSMATPHVAGAVALILQAHHDWTPIMVKASLIGYASSVNGEHLWRQGAGRIDVVRSTNASLLVLESSFSFGSVGLNDEKNATLTVLNTGSTSVLVNVSTLTYCEGDMTNYVNLNTSSFTVPSYDSVGILLQVGPLDDLAPEGWYEGWVNLTTAYGDLRAPYLFEVFSILTVSMFDVDNEAPVSTIFLITSYPDMEYVGFSWASTTSKFYLESGSYAIITQSSWVETIVEGSFDKDFSRAYMLQKVVSIPKLSSINVSMSLSEARVSIIPTVDLFGENLTVHSYNQYFSGGSQLWYEYFPLSEWSMSSIWTGFDLNISKITLYSTEFLHPDRLCEAMGYYASGNMFSEVHLMPLKFWNTSYLPDVICYSQSDVAKNYVFYNVPETYPENGLNAMNAFWFTWDHLGPFQIWLWDEHNVYAGINATYFLAPEVATYWGIYMPTYEGWLYMWRGPLQEWSIGRHYPYPQISLQKGEIGNLTLGRFTFAPYDPGLCFNVNVSAVSSGYNVTVMGDIWNNLSWPHWQWKWLETDTLISPYPQEPFPIYRLYVDGELVYNGTLGRVVEGAGPSPEQPGVWWDAICQSWNVNGSNVKLCLDMPSLATLSSSTIYNVSFNLNNGNFSIPPLFIYVDMPLSYDPEENLTVRLDKPDMMNNFSLLYSFNNGTTWHSATNTTNQFKINCEEADALAILINATDIYENQYQYFSSPVALCRKVNLNVSSEVYAETSGSVEINGNLTSVEGRGIPGIAIALFKNNSTDNPIYTKTDENGAFHFVYPDSCSNDTFLIISPSVGVYGSEYASTSVRSLSVIINEVIVSSQRCDVNTTQKIWIHAKWTNNGLGVNGGSIFLNGTAYNTNQTGWICVEETSATVGKNVWIITAINCSGVTTFETQCDNPSIIWDRIDITLQVEDGRINVNDNGTITWSGVYEYDRTPFAGAVSLNDTTSKADVDLYTYTVQSISDPAYGLSAFRSNVVSIIFDAVNLTLHVEDSRIRVGENATITWSGQYEYDNTGFTGSMTLNNSQTQYDTVCRKGFRVSSIIDPAYGLTVFESNEVWVIWEYFSADIILDARLDNEGYVLVDLSLNSSAHLSGGLGAYSLNLSASEGIVLIEVLGGDDPFGSPPTANMIDGRIVINSFISEAQGPQMTELRIASLRLRLNGTVNSECVFEVTQINVVDAVNGTEYPGSITSGPLRFMRGDVNDDGQVSIADAMFVAQYLAGNRTASDLNLLNTASIKQDESEGDKITIADAMFIAQYLAGLRNEYLNLQG